MNAAPTAANDLLARFRRKIAANAAAWRHFVQNHGNEPAALDRELANLTKAAQQALAEPAAWEEGLALIGETWAHVELRGYWRDWQALMHDGLRVSQQIERPDHEARLLDQLGEVARLLGDNHKAQQHFEAALALLRAQADLAGAGRVLTHLSQVQVALGALEAAAQSCQEAAAHLAALDLPGDLAIAHNNWGLVCIEQGALDAALAHFEQAAAGFRRVGNQRGEAKTITNRGEVYRHMQRWDEAAQCYRQALALHQALGDELHVASQNMNLSIIHYQQGRAAEALAVSLQAEAALRRLHHRPFLARACNNHGIFLTALDRLAEAREAFDQAARLHLANGDRLYAANSLGNCAEILLDQNQLSQAANYLTQMRALLDALPHPSERMERSYQTYMARLQAQEETQPIR